MTPDEIMELANKTAGQHWMDEAHIQRFASALIAAERQTHIYNQPRYTNGCPVCGIGACRMTPYERIVTALITACMIGFIALLVWAAL